MSEDIANVSKEKTTIPAFRVVQMDEEWAFEYGKNMREKWPEWEAKKYELNGPPSLLPYIKGKITEEEFKQQLHDWYGSWNCDMQIEQLQSCEQVFNTGIAQYLFLQKWGFDIPDSYQVVVTPFTIGGGGAGERTKKHGPVITMWYGRDWSKPGNRIPEETLLHEAYHLGIDGIIDELGFDQETRERIVDIGSQQILVPNVLQKTHIQRKNVVMPIDSYLANTSVTLPMRLQQYKQFQQKL